MSRSSGPAVSVSQTLTLADGSIVSLSDAPAADDEITAIARDLATIDPWKRYGFSAARMEQAMRRSGEGAELWVFRDAGMPAGVAAIRRGWLAGSYLALLAVLPSHQGKGLGGAFLSWHAAEGRHRGERNQFVAASEFNTSALAFYERAGFARVASLPLLLDDRETEILLRRRLAGPQ